MAKTSNKKTELVQEDAEQPAKKTTAKVFTYVGGGEDSPRIINFMGMQEFIRGKATEVTNAEVLSKIIDNPCFVEGEVDPEDLDAHDVKAKKEADQKRAADKKFNAEYSKKHRVE